MLGVPTNVWGHTILAYLQVHDIQALHCTNKHLRAGTSLALKAYKQWLLSEIQTLNTHPSLKYLHSQIASISIEANSKLQPISRAHIAEIMAYHHPHPYLQAVAETAVLLFLGPVKDYWMTFLRFRLEFFVKMNNFDYFAPLLVKNLPYFDAFLAARSAEEYGKVTVLGEGFYRFLQEVVKIGRIRSQGDYDELELRLRSCGRELEAVEALEKAVFRA